MKRTAEQADYLALVARTRCALGIALGENHRPVAIHHPRFSEGAGTRAQDWLVIGLCPECHQGDLGVHGDRTLMRIAKVDEADLLAITISEVHRLRVSDYHEQVAPF